MLVFEQPLNEQIRICLKMEQLLHQLNQYLADSSVYASQSALVTLLHIIDVIDRADLKSKLMQMLSQYSTTLGQLERFPQVDPKRLQSILSRLDALVKQLNQLPGRIGDSLRNNDFLNQLRVQANAPGGIFLYHAPMFALWLKQPLDQRHHELSQWVEILDPLPEITDLILDITRHSTSAQTVSADNGFYHQTLDTTLPCHMIRVALSPKLGIYPEISAGKHRFSVRCLQTNYLLGEKPKQVNEPVSFSLTCCQF